MDFQLMAGLENYAVSVLFAVSSPVDGAVVGAVSGDLPMETVHGIFQRIIRRLLNVHLAGIQQCSI